MLEYLGELGIIFILLALFGFVIKDAFQFGLILKPPNLYKTYILSLFHYVSIAVYVLSFCIALLFMILAAPNQENFITSFFNSIFDYIEYLENAGMIQSGISNKIFSYLAISFFPALFYFFLISIVMIGGKYSRLISGNWIRVTFKNEEQEEYPKILSDDDDFVYLENKNRKNEWESIRKDDIQKMECIHHKSRLSDMINLTKEDIRDMWREHKYFLLAGYLFEKLFIIVLMVILLIPLIFH